MNINDQFSKRFAVGKIFRVALAAVVLSVLSACGGGGGSAGSTGGSGGSGGTGTTNNGSIQLSLVDQAGTPSNLISGSAGLLAKAVVTNSSGGSVGPGVLVTFSLDGTIAALSATSGTALTGSDGVATMGLKAAIGTGAGTLTASAIVVGTTAVTKQATFSVNAPPNAKPAALNFVTAVPNDKSIVIKGTGGISRSEVALVTFSVVDGSNVGIPNVKVNFSLLQGIDVVLGATSGVSDPSGKVTVAVNSGSSVTTVRVIATVNDTTITTLSDTITVSTGSVDNKHFNIYPENINVEAFNHAGIENKITAYLGDGSGGPVSDNTAVVFTTDGGAIIGDDGKTDTARCLTKNGACTVVWRSQDPFLASPTIFATASNGIAVLAKSTGFVANSSFGHFVGLPATITFSTCTPQSFQFTVVGENGYSMPTGTTMPPSDVTNVAATVFPPTVSARADGAQAGTTHTLTVTPTTACPKGAGHFFLELTTPKGDKSGIKKIDIVYP